VARTCPACGRDNDDDARFCKSCGAALPVTPPPPVPAQPPVTPPPPGPGAPPAGPRQPRTGAPAWLIVLIAVAVIVLAVVLALVFYPRGKSDDNGGSSTPTTAATTTISPAPALGQYLAAAVGPRADKLATISADGTVTPITRFSGDQIWQIAYSPDGKWLACIAGTYKRSELWLFDAVSGAGKQATANAPSVVAVDSLAWLADGELLVAGYTETPQATGQNADFLIYDTAAESFAPLQDSGGVALRGVSVSASRDGSWVSFVTYSDLKSNSYGMATAKERLEVLDRGSGTVTELGTNKAEFDVNARAFDEPLISPNGEAIIYRRAGSDVGTSYTVVGTDGTTLMPAKETQLPAGYAWDPSGTKVVFTGHSLKPATTSSGIGPAVFWVFDTAAGGRPRVIAQYKDTMVQDLAWSPDGASIAWAEYDQKKYRTGTLYIMPAAGGDSQVFAEEALSPVWAPGAAQALLTSPSPEQ
jgi:Tol biopolymer transport system component